MAAAHASPAVLRDSTSAYAYAGVDAIRARPLHRCSAGENDATYLWCLYGISSVRISKQEADIFQLTDDYIILRRRRARARGRRHAQDENDANIDARCPVAAESLRRFAEIVAASGLAASAAHQSPFRLEVAAAGRNTCVTCV